MSRRISDEQETPADHWKNRTVQNVKRVPGLTELGRGDAGTAKRRRLRSIALRFVLVLMFFCSVAGIGWLAWDYAIAGGAPGSPKVSEVKFETDGTLDKTWMLSQVDFGAMPPLFRIKAKLEEEPQVREVVVKRTGEEAISVKVFERAPVARLYVKLPDGTTEARLVATDGVLFRGLNMGHMTLANLPLLEGARPKPGAVADYIEGFEPVAGFLTLARERHPALYREWLRVSLRDYRGRPDAPGALIRVKPRLTTQSPDSAAIVEVLFSPTKERYTVELNDLDFNMRQWVASRLREADRARYPAFVLDMSIWNMSNPRRPYPEPRLIPVPLRQP